MNFIKLKLILLGHQFLETIAKPFSRIGFNQNKICAAKSVENIALYAS